MSRSKQVVAAVSAAALGGGLALLGSILANGHSQNVTNNINHSIVNQNYAGTPVVTKPSPATTPSCPQELLGTIGSGTLSVVIAQKAPGTPCWTQELAPVTSGTTLRYLITYQNLSRVVQRDVIVRVSLAPHTSLVPNSTYLYNSNNAHGVLYDSNDIKNGGIVIGNYAPGAVGYVVLSVTVPFPENLDCGWNDFRAVGVVRPRGLDEFYNTVETEVDKVC
jgi:hypothetical protein